MYLVYLVQLLYFHRYFHEPRVIILLLFLIDQDTNCWYTSTVIMANTRELRRRIKSVKNTAQITKAMQMVSATKMRRAQNQALGGRPYSSTLSSIINLIEGKSKVAAHDLLKSNGSEKVGVLVLTSDKGLAGALNTNIFRRLTTDPTLQGENVQFYTVGRKGREFIVRIGKKLEADFENPEKVNFRQAKKLRKILMDAFLAGDLGEVYILYPDFKSALRQEPRLIRILPISFEAPDDNNTIVIANEVKQSSSKMEIATSTTSPRNDEGDFIFEPTPDAVLDFALVHHVETQIYQALLETKASEHSARMIAMQSATDNAKALVEDLQLTYNQVRQTAITTEILEISSASAALE